MKQVLIKRGQAIVEDVPVPVPGDGDVLVQVAWSCISVGTEMTGLKSGGKSLINRLIDQPENIKKGFKLIKEQGLSKTMGLAKSMMDMAIPVGYSAAGMVVETGANIRDIAVGDHVACAGAGIASHAEFIAVPQNLLVPVPDGLSLYHASTVTLGSIALQGIRRAEPNLGDSIAVVGLGILGQLTAQMLKANGCRVIGIDVDKTRVDHALDLGMDKGLTPSEGDVVDAVVRFSHGYGADAVIITASTAGSEVINQAIEMCRKKGTVVIVGAVGMDLKRDEFYRKELDLRISTSYGPGRYDERYEQKGLDYPYAYVRWTENRNMQEYLRLLANKSITVEPLIDRTWSIDDAPKAYEELKSSGTKPLITLLRYAEEPVRERKVVISKAMPDRARINVAVIGAGTFAKGMHLPNLRKLDQYCKIHAIAGRKGTNATAIAKEYQAAYATTDYHEVLRDNDTDMVMICTRHNLHASMAIEAAKSEKAVFVEKPMALNKEELDELVTVLGETKVPFMVGFNRRFSPYARKMKEIVKDRQSPMIINYRMNAGFIPHDHWVHTEEGGGRNIGEACHIYDLFTFLTESETASVSAYSIRPQIGQYGRNDNFTATITYTDGSVCNLIYTALGSTDVPKEQMDIYVDGMILSLNDYKKLDVFGARGRVLETRAQQKGQFEELETFATSIKHGDGYPIPLWQLIQATEISFKVEEII